LTITDPIPTKATLAKYGLKESEYARMYRAQNGKCAVCNQIPYGGKLRIDHEHVPGWARMQATERRLYVRGLLCYLCNRFYLGKGITLQKAEGMVAYLRKYELRSIKDLEAL